MLIELNGPPSHKTVIARYVGRKSNTTEAPGHLSVWQLGKIQE